MFETYGFKNFYEQYCFQLNIQKYDDKGRFKNFYERVAKNLNVRYETLKKKSLSKYVKDFCEIYNQAWSDSHLQESRILPEMAESTFKKILPFVDEDLVIFTYQGSKPIGFLFNLPELNHYFKHCRGKLGWVEIAKIIWMRIFSKSKNAVGLIYGIIPEFQRKATEVVLFYNFFLKALQKNYQEYEMIWIGDFNTNMISICKNMGAQQSRKLITYRFLFDKSKPFNRHPQI